MAIVKVQSPSYDFGFTGGTSSTCTYTSALTPGSKLIAYATVGANVTPSFSDSANGAWTTVVTRFWANVGSVVALGWVDNTSSASSVVVTIAHGGASQVLRSGGISEWTGLATGAQDVFTAGNNSTGTTVTDVAMTTTGADLVIGATAAEQTLSAGSGFTALALNASSATAWEYLIQGGAGSSTSTFGQSPSGQAVLISAGFAPTGGGGPTLPPIIVMPPRRP